MRVAPMLTVMLTGADGETPQQARGLDGRAAFEQPPAVTA
jgi:hypothetical protein